VKNFIDFTEKTVIIAGASSGIGKKTAEILNSYGAKIIAIARREEKLQELIANLGREDNKYYAVDLLKTSEIEGALKIIKNENGPVDGLVYTSGIGDPRPVKMAKPDFLERMMRINFFGFYEMVRIITKKGFYNPGMSIVGISSCASINGSKSQSVYSATKAAMDAAVRVMAQEYADKGIRINTVRPGMVKTAMYKGFLDSLGERGNELLLNKQFMGVGETEDIANAIAFLLSSVSNFTTGAHFSIDGGNTCH